MEGKTSTGRHREQIMNIQISGNIELAEQIEPILEESHSKIDFGSRDRSREGHSKQAKEDLLGATTPINNGQLNKGETNMTHFGSFSPQKKENQSAVKDFAPETIIVENQKDGRYKDELDA